MVNGHQICYYSNQCHALILDPYVHLRKDGYNKFFIQQHRNTNNNIVSERDIGVEINSTELPQPNSISYNNALRFNKLHSSFSKKNSFPFQLVQPQQCST